MWRYSNCFLLLLLVIISAPVPAGAEMMAGTVVSVDREQGTFVLRTEGQQEVQVHTGISQLPWRMIAGKKIRIWGKYGPDDKNFTATDIRGSGNKRHHDPTGVRARIGNGKYCRKSSNSDTVDANGEQGRHKFRGSGNGRSNENNGSSR